MRLDSVARVIRSKNAGPCLLTFDLMLPDAASFAAVSEKLPVLVDQGEADEFLEAQLKPELLREACATAGHPLDLRIRPGHDHGYYFIASFIGEHIAHHAVALRD